MGHLSDLTVWHAEDEGIWYFIEVDRTKFLVIISNENLVNIE